MSEAESEPELESDDEQGSDEEMAVAPAGMVERWEESALRTAITKLDRKRATGELEALLGVISKAMEHPGNRKRRRVSVFGSGTGLHMAEDLMLAAGFVMESERREEYRDAVSVALQPYMTEEFFVLPDAVGLNTLRHIQRVLRSALRERYDPAVESPRLVARLSHLSFDQLAELLASACLRDSTTRAQTEALLGSVDSMPWDTLPALVVSDIAVRLQGGDGLAWCAVCRSFRAAQPALRVLVIGSSYDTRRFRSSLQDEFGVAFMGDYEQNVNGDAHRIIESMSPRHAAELTHLYAAPWLRSPDVPLRAYPERVIGAHLTALRVLNLTHPGRGWTGGFCAEFAAASCQLIQGVSPTLHTLDVQACTQFKTDNLLSVIPGLGGLARLSLDISGGNMMGGEFGRPENTRRVKRLVRQVCTALEEPAYVKCHTRGTDRDEQGRLVYPAGPDSANEGDSEVDA